MSDSKIEISKGFSKRNTEEFKNSLDIKLKEEAKDFISGAKPKFQQAEDPEPVFPSKKYQPRAPRKIPFNLRMDVAVREAIEKIAEAEDRSLHWVTEQIIKEGIRKRAANHGLNLKI